VNVYAETSAVLRWLFAGPRGEEVRATLAGASAVFTSRLTLVEARRALIRAVCLGEMSEAQSRALSAMLAAAARRWNIVELTGGICERSEQRFPFEPVRSLDALHLATALYLYGELGSLVVLTTDERLVKNGPLLGLPLALPPTDE